MHPHIQKLIRCIELEEKEQATRYKLDQSQTLKQLKAEGLAIHPIRVTKKYFGFAEYPEISFKIPYPQESNQFRDGASIECFASGAEPIKGILLGTDGKIGELRLFAPDFPDWIEDDNLGIKLSPDTRTSTIMTRVLKNLETNKSKLALFEQFHIKENKIEKLINVENINFENTTLNDSQKKAVQTILNTKNIVVVHGPPGTGKTTTLVEAIKLLVVRGEKILVSAPSNTAVDHISKKLIEEKINVLRVGNITKADPLLFDHSPEGRMQQSAEIKEIKELKKRADEFRRMALKYKRSFGKDEREQRNLLFQEVKNIRSEIKKIQEYHSARLYKEADVIAGTPIGIYDEALKDNYDTLIIDEAGQCIEPLAWCIMPLANKIVLAGDHLQLPPTILSQDASNLGLNKSILEVAIHAIPNPSLLNTQYRMRASIAGFSSNYFYSDALITPSHLSDQSIHITFIDTAGSGYQEKTGADGLSLQNEGELSIVEKLIEQEVLDVTTTAFIAPYSGQIAAAKEQLQQGLRISTIDSFQGQEKENIIISLVRSNDEGIIGFLKDYRRMNVAITRAKEKLFVIGDSSTIGNDLFYKSFLDYVEKYGAYRTVWEFM